MSKIVLFVLMEQYADWEVAYLASAFHMLGQGTYAGKTMSVAAGSVASIGGLRTQIDYTVETAPEEYAGLVLIGGMCWRGEAARQVEPLVRAALANGRLLAGICDAAGFLATAGALNHARHTGNDLADIKAWAGAAYTGEKNFVARQAVRDGNIITANGTAPLEFAREVLLALEAAPPKKIEEWFAFHKLGFYGAPMPEM